MQLYGAATMNNTLCLMVFTALVFAKGLSWQFSAGSLKKIFFCSLIISLNCAEITVILLIEFAVGMLVIVPGFFYKHTYIVSVPCSLMMHARLCCN